LPSTDNTCEVALLFGIDDDNKSTLKSGRCLWLNRPIEQWLELGFTTEELWPDAGEQSVWTARLWAVGPTGWTTLRWLLSCLEPARSGARRKLRPAEWAAMPRWSWQELLAAVDHQK